MTYPLITIAIVLIIYNLRFSYKKRYNSSYYDSYDFSDRVIGIFMTTVMTAGIYIVAALLTAYSTDTHITKTVKVNIVSTNRNQNLNGSFFIGSGTVNSNKVYAVMVKLEEKDSYIEKNLPQNTIIVEDTDNNTSYYEYTTCDNTKNTMYDLGKFKTVFVCLDDTQSHFKLHIPKNTIIKEFSVR
jgi:hypothetical protein